MIILGSPEWRHVNGIAWEIRYMLNGTEIAIVHGDLISKCSVQRGVIGADTFEITLAGNDSSGLGLLPQQGHIDVWVHVPEGAAPISMGFGEIDYFDSKFEKGEHVIELQARGAIAQLIDKPWKQSFRGFLADLLRHAADGSVKMDVRGLSEQRIEAYIHAPSAYGALRLLGISFGFLIEEDRDGSGIPCRSIATAKEDERSSPPTLITSEDIISGNVTRGRPIRRREDPSR